jgi:hypothetical protein
MKPTPPPPSVQRITELFAWVCIHENGAEGVPAIDSVINGRPACVPLIGADRTRMESYRVHALSIAAGMGLPVKLVHFSNVEVLETYEPAGVGKGGTA